MSDLSLEQKSLVETIAEDFPNFSLDDVTEILPKVMLQVSTYKKLNVEQQKKMIIKMIEHVIDITDAPGDDDIWDPVIKRMLPGVINLLVENNKGKLALKKPRKWFLLCK